MSRAIRNHLFSSCCRILWAFAFTALSALPAMGAGDLARLREEVAGNPAKAQGAVIRAIQSTGGSKPHWAARVTVAALQGLGVEATPKQTGAIVYAAVRTAPDQVLEIVHAATLASPHEVAPNIAAAATAAVPHPWKKVKYRPDTATLASYRAEGDGKEIVDDKSDKKAVAPLDAVDREMPLAEAIAQAAGGTAPVVEAVDETLVGSPDWLLGFNTNLTPYGDFGLPNYGNEPHPVLAPNIPNFPPSSP